MSWALIGIVLHTDLPPRRCSWRWWLWGDSSGSYAPVHLAEVIGAVLRYDGSGDEEAEELQQKVRAEGERPGLARYAGLEEDHPLVNLVLERADHARG